MYLQPKALTLRGMLSGTVVPSKRIIPWSTVMVRSGRKRDGEIRQIPGAHEKGDYMSVPRTDTGAPR